MITAIDIACMQIIQGEKKPEHIHYHLQDPMPSKPVHIFEEANFHLVDRNIAMSQIGFDYYANIVTYRV